MNQRTHVPRTTAIVGLENPVLATPDVLVGLGGALVSTRLLLEVDVRVGETRDAHCDCAGAVSVFQAVRMSLKGTMLQRQMVRVMKVDCWTGGKSVSRELAWPSIQ